VFWVSALLLIAAVGIYFAPAGFFSVSYCRVKAPPAAAAMSDARGAGEAAPAAASAGASAAAAQLAATPSSADALPVPAESPLATPTGAMPATDAAALVGPAAADLGGAGPGVIQLHTTAPSWIEVTDGGGRSLVARVVPPGETIDLEGAAPFRVRIGNASGTKMSYRGQPLELAAYTRDNVARLELK